MTTTIKSTALDFTAIKNNLKTFLANKEEFEDYNFEASALSNVLDVLAYNTHYNGLVANFALNESFLSTAQLRSSLVSIAQGIGYIPKSKTTAQAVIRLSLNLTGVTGRPSTIGLPANTKFKSTVNDVVYDFYTRDNITATDNGSGEYEFLTATGDSDIIVYEGQVKQKTFLVGPYSESLVYVIPEPTIDTSTAIVRVYESATSGNFTTYSNIVEATVINDDTTLYILKEAPNGFYELSFGDGITLGKSPESGNKVVVDYLKTNGTLANTAKVFVPSSSVAVNGVNYELAISTVTSALGGSDEESIDSIRKNAPFQYAAQNRMVTAADYSTLVLRNFSTQIKDIKAWGGEDALKPRFGAIYLSIVFEDGIPESTQTATKTAIVELAKQLSIISFDLVFEDPITTFLESNVFFQFNPQLTTLSLNSIQSEVNTVVENYFANTVGEFDKAFRRSNLLTLVDDVSPAVLSSRADIKMQQRITPSSIVQDFNLRFPASILEPDDINYVVTTTTFIFNSKVCMIRNRLNTNKLEVVSITDQVIQIDNIGSYNPTAGTLNITGLSVESVVGGVDFLKISLVPSNQSSIITERNDIVVYDNGPSFTSGIITTST